MKYFTNFDEHCRFYQQQNPNSRAILKCDLLLSWMVEVESPVTELTEQGEIYYHLTDEEFDILTW